MKNRNINTPTRLAPHAASTAGMPELRLTHGLNNIGTISPSPATPSQNHHVQKPPPNAATSARTLPSSPSARPTKTPPAGRFHPIPRDFHTVYKLRFRGMRVTALAYRHGDQCHRRTGRDAGEEEQHRQDRVIKERIRFQRRQQKTGISPNNTASTSINVSSPR